MRSKEDWIADALFAIFLLGWGLIFAGLFMRSLEILVGGLLTELIFLVLLKSMSLLYRRRRR